MDRMNNDQIGKIAELQFDVECSRRDLFCAWPSIDRNGYDCIVDNGAELIKVQCKSTMNTQTRLSGAEFYNISVKRGMQGRDYYNKDHFDVLAIYIHPLDCWYFMPFSEVACTTIKIYPDSPTSKHTKWKNNWDIFKSPNKGAIN